MGLEELVKEIRHNAAEEEKRVLAAAHEQAREALKAAVEESHGIIAAAKAEGAAMAIEETRKISSARLKAKRVMAEEREAVIQAALFKLQRRLGELASAKAGEKRKLYEKLFAKLAKQATSELNGSVVIHCRKQDAPLAAKWGKPKGLDCTGGLIAEDADGKVRVSYTFDSLMEQYAIELKRIAYGSLFGIRRPLAEARGKPAKAASKAVGNKSKAQTIAKAPKAPRAAGKSASKQAKGKTKKGKKR